VFIQNAVVALEHDATQEAIYRNLEEAGVSEKVLNRLDHYSRPSGYGPDLNNPESAEMYRLLVLEGLTELAAKKNSKRSKK
jgi:hypothetical protein